MEIVSGLITTNCSKDHQKIYQQWFNFVDSGSINTTNCCYFNFMIYLYVLVSNVLFICMSWLCIQHNNVCVSPKIQYQYVCVCVQMVMDVLLEMMPQSSSLCPICLVRISNRLLRFPVFSCSLMISMCITIVRRMELLEYVNRIVFLLLFYELQFMCGNS